MEILNPAHGPYFVVSFQKLIRTGVKLRKLSSTKTSKFVKESIYRSSKFSFFLSLLNINKDWCDIAEIVLPLPQFLPPNLRSAGIEIAPPNYHNFPLQIDCVLFKTVTVCPHQRQQTPSL
jgi:hypothetical protein